MGYRLGELEIVRPNTQLSEAFTIAHDCFTHLAVGWAYVKAMNNTSIDAHLLLAILKVAREECSHNHWNEMEPVLAAAWDELRDDGTPSWEIVADEIQHACRQNGYLSNGASSS